MLVHPSRRLHPILRWTALALRRPRCRLIQLQLIHGSISEQQNTLYNMASTTSGIGSMTVRTFHLPDHQCRQGSPTVSRNRPNANTGLEQEHGIHWVESRGVLSIQASWSPAVLSITSFAYSLCPSTFETYAFS